MKPPELLADKPPGGGPAGTPPQPRLTPEESSNGRPLGLSVGRIFPPEGPGRPPPAVALRRETDGPVVVALTSGVAGQTRLRSSGWAQLPGGQREYKLPFKETPFSGPAGSEAAQLRLGAVLS